MAASISTSEAVERTWPGQGRDIHRRGRRGCDLANAAVELTEEGHPGLRVIEEFKIRQRERLTNLCKGAGASQPDLLADTLFLLIEGARVSRRSVGTNGPSANLVRTCRGVIASFGVRPPALASRRTLPRRRYPILRSLLL
jgi:hypothetical protein